VCFTNETQEEIQKYKNASKTTCSLPCISRMKREVGQVSCINSLLDYFIIIILSVLHNQQIKIIVFFINYNLDVRIIVK